MRQIAILHVYIAIFCLTSVLFTVPACQDRSRNAKSQSPPDDGTAATNLTRLQSPDRNVRKQAVDKLGELKDPSSVDALIKALTDPDRIVRYSAAEALGNFTDPKAIEPLGKALYDSDSLVRLDATKSLAKYKDKKTLDYLIYASQGYDYQVKWAAAKGLFYLPDPKAVKPLILLVEDDVDDEVIVAAAEALGENGSADALPALRKRLEHKSSAVRQAASRAIGRIEKNASR